MSRGSKDLHKITRRALLAAGIGGGASMAMLSGLPGLHGFDSGSGSGGDDDEGEPSPFNFTPFTRPLPIPPVLQPVGQLPGPPVGQCLHGIAPEWGTVPQPGSERGDAGFEEGYQPAADIIEQVIDATLGPGTPTKFYFQRILEGRQRIIPNVESEIFGYGGNNDVATFPGPTIIERIGQPIVVRYQNDLIAEASVHLHGGHSPAHPDGYPTFFVLQNECRDYYYPNIVPLEDGEPDFNESPSTMWYHDHANDITGHNVNRGLVAFYLTVDDFESNLIDTGVLPGGTGSFSQIIPGYGETDIPLAISDKRLNADGSLFYNFFDHDGQLGDIFTVNGIAQPFLEVFQQKYRFRILSVGTARTWAYRLSRRMPFLVIGNDSWLVRRAFNERIITLGTAQRADVIIDFSRFSPGTEIFLENVMVQDDGRGPDEIDPSEERTRLLKFIVKAGTIGNNATIERGQNLRPITPIRRRDIVTTRNFEFERGNGAWKINELFFNPERADAVPAINCAERWFLENSSGGWWHPIHIHLESHQVINHTEGVARPRIGERSDTTMLGPNGRAEILMKFRTFLGPFAMHCHNLEHEDMRMMTSFDPRPAGTNRPLDNNGMARIPEFVTGVPGNIQEGEFAEDNVDHDRLRDRDQDVVGEITAPQKP